MSYQPDLIATNINTYLQQHENKELLWLPSAHRRAKYVTTTRPASIQKMRLTTTSERQGRVIEHHAAASMEEKKKGYFCCWLTALALLLFSSWKDGFILLLYAIASLRWARKSPVKTGPPLVGLSLLLVHESIGAVLAALPMKVG